MPELNEEDRQIFEAIGNGDAVLLKALLTDKKHVNLVDENSMTPLQHAAYKGSHEMVQMLLDQGADVNLCEHQHKYTALHFAGLSGNVECCLALLLAGATSNVANSVGRNPAQMAAFVGHHNCVATINNFVPKSDVEAFTAGDSKTRLEPFLTESFHRFIMQVNIHPVKVVMNLQSYAGLMEHLPQVEAVLKAMSEREMKRGAENNETMAFKFHYLSYIVGEVIKLKDQQASKSQTQGAEKKSVDVPEVFSRRMLKPSKDDVLETMELHVKECVREFRFRDSNLFRQMVASITQQDAPTALSVVSAGINGQRGFIDNLSACSTCGEERAGKKCSKCKAVQYCDRNCQRLHWHWHKKVCGKLADKSGVAAEAPDASHLSNHLENFVLSDAK